MRIADKMQYEQVNTNIGKNRSQMSDLQNQAATQKRVNKPSDDPLAASRVLSNRVDLQGNRQYSKSLSYAKSFLEFTDQSLGDLSEVLMRAKELAISQSNDASANEETRKVVATEVEQLMNQMVSIGNRKLGDRFLFAGYKTQTPPFTPSGKYKGDSGEINIHIDKEVFLPMNIPGARVFLGLGVDRNGGVAPTLPQPRTIDEFADQQISGMPESSLLPPQTPSVSQRGPASIGGMRTPEVVNNRVNGENPPEDESYGVNLFKVMRDLEISLRTNDKGAVQSTLDEMDDALNQVILMRAQVGSRGMAIDNYMGTMEKQKVDNQVSISSLEDADIFSTVSDINKTENTLQATLQTSGKLIEKSLLDFLR